MPSPSIVLHPAPESSPEPRERPEAPELVEPAATRTVNPLQLALFPARLFLALGWTRAGVEKLIDSNWWTGEYLLDFFDAQQETALPFTSWATDLVGPWSAIAISFFVLTLEFAIGFCLLTGRRLTTALAAASALNVAFVALGAVNPSAFYLVIQLTLIVGLVATRPVMNPKRELTVIAGCSAIGIAMAPFISTLHPHGVIEDPAIMLATLAMLVAATFTIRLFDHYQNQNIASSPPPSRAARNLRAWATWLS